MKNGVDREEMMSAELITERRESDHKKKFGISHQGPVIKTPCRGPCRGRYCWEYIEAISNVNDTISDLSDDWEAITRRDLLPGAIGS